jgi:hypothetical protein
MQVSRTAPAAPMPPAELIALIEAQRAGLSRVDVEGGTALDRINRQLADALAGLFPAGSQRAHRLPPLPAGYDAETLRQIRQALQINQTLLTRASSQNRQGLNALFGEPGVYGR